MDYGAHSAPGWWVPWVAALPALAGSVAAVLSRHSRVRVMLYRVNVLALGTVVHEAWHAAAGVLTGGGVHMIKVDTPHSGMTRTWYPSWLSRVIGSLAFAALAWGPLWVQHWVAYAATWVLLVSEISGLWVLVRPRLRRSGMPQFDDARNLRENTGVPGLVWIAGWAALIGWCLWLALPLPAV
ncbi:M50 family metallopeptidase [Saccharothrix saharensis]|uniref:M50 family metallopeptidase n=1 Tax=Saccharothrix saharensis TaxID=571190 RepID=UPI0036CFB59F